MRQEPLVGLASEALAAFVEAVGPSHVLVDAELLAAAGSATFATSQRVSAIVRPHSVEEVQACVRVANRFAVPLYPVSGGRNWGLGSRVPVRDGSVVLDLAGMNAISAHDERLGTITVEPGVTFRQAQAFLEARASDLVIPVTGGPADGSLIGNTVERGDPVGPWGDRLHHVCALEVVLPTGELVHTGFARFPEARTAHLHRWGVGPALDGLFTQSNLGIVTRMTMWLVPRPAFFESFACTIDGRDALSRFLDAAQPLLLRGALPGYTLTLWNSYKVLASRGRYPWTATGGRTPFDLAAMKGRAPWLAHGTISAPSLEIGEATRAYVKRNLDSVAGPLYFGGDRANMRHSRPGQVSDANIRSVYWRKRMAVPDDVDPDRDRCGVIWLCVALPFEGAEAAAVTAHVERHVLAHGFEPNVGLTCVSPRCLHVFVSLFYDRDVPGEDARAQACHDELFSWLTARGHLPYRLGIHSMAALPDAHADDTALLAALKRLFDPNGVLAPGRYDVRER